MLQIGARLQREGIAFEKILSSPWCRCIDTAKLLISGRSKPRRPLAMWWYCGSKGRAHRGRPRAHRQMERAMNAGAESPRRNIAGRR